MSDNKESEDTARSAAQMIHDDSNNDCLDDGPYTFNIDVDNYDILTKVTSDFYSKATFQLDYTTAGMAAYLKWFEDLGPERRSLVKNVSMVLYGEPADQNSATLTKRKKMNPEEVASEHLKNIRADMREHGLTLDNAKLKMDTGKGFVTDRE